MGGSWKAVTQGAEMTRKREEDPLGGSTIRTFRCSTDKAAIERRRSKLQVLRRPGLTHPQSSRQLESVESLEVPLLPKVRTLIRR